MIDVELTQKLEETALLIIDVQKDFCGGGALAVSGGDEVVPIANQLATLPFKSMVASVDCHPPNHISFASSHSNAALFEVIDVDASRFGVSERFRQCLWPNHCVEGSEGVEFHTDLQLRDTCLKVLKGRHPGVDSYSAFGDIFEGKYERTELEALLKKESISRVVVVGLALDHCVAATARDAMRLGFATTVIKEGCRGVEQTSTDAAVEHLKRIGVSVVERVDEFLATL
jgi:nicotinamidase/pyrazinamidase